MSIERLQEARKRLERAVARLEQAARERPAGHVNGEGALVEELETVRARCVALEQRSLDVSRRLDAAIDRVRGLLEE